MAMKLDVFEGMFHTNREIVFLKKNNEKNMGRRKRRQGPEKQKREEKLD
jgi:hypothetical protein